jgi:uncharacterized protein (DUF2235 family)
MPKNIVLCCDGTANEFAQDHTNVIKLFSTLIHDPLRQICYYHPGLGTMEPPGALTTIARRITKILGQVIGYNLEADIRDTYVYLMRNFEPGDQVYMFGFSRGAYTVRATASLLHMYGLIRAGNEPLVPYAIRMLNSMNDKKRFGLSKQFLNTFSITDCKPKFVGVWDTVSSVGWIENPLKVPYSANNPDISIGRHALAIDERRAFFPQNLWRPSEIRAAGPKDLKQVWFPGVHCDVGGGYPEKESGLSKISLEWMAKEAQSAGLLIDENKLSFILGKRGKGIAIPDPNAIMHESLKGFLWYLCEFIPKKYYDLKKGTTRRRMNLFRPRVLPPNSMIHESAFQRSEEYQKKLPKDAIKITAILS